MFCKDFLRGVLYLSAMILAACAPDDDSAPEAGTAEQVTLRVMSFNIEWGGTHVSFDNVTEAIRQAGPDIVGIQEAEGNLRRLAGALGWNYHERTYVISPHRLLDPPDAAGRYVLVEVEPGRAVAIGNVHLPSAPYGPHAVQEGAAAREVIELEQAVRLAEIRPQLEVLPPLAGRGMPVFVTGDFNAPAHTDWTAATTGTRPHLRYPLAWPVSLAMEQAGFRDSWRVRWPDPLSDPGLTWWAARPSIPDFVIGKQEPRDRIDFVWYAGPATVVDSELAGATGAAGVSFGVTPWPSDHRGVVSEFDVLPAAVPDLVTTGRRVYREGDAVEILHFLARDETVPLTVVDLDSGDAVATRQLDGNGRLLLPARRFGSGHYAVHAGAADDGLAPREFWVLARDAAAAIATSGELFAYGETIDVQWRDAPGHRNDYIAVYPAGVTPSVTGNPSWVYVDARPAGLMHLNESTLGDRWPIAPGRYVAWLLKDDGYQPLARSGEFTISESR